MPDLIATRARRYGGKALQAGDRFTASQKDAKLLKAIRYADDAPAEADEASDETGADAPQRSSRRGYQRRDMQAEG